MGEKGGGFHSRLHRGVPCPQLTQRICSTLGDYGLYRPSLLSPCPPFRDGCCRFGDSHYGVGSHLRIPPRGHCLCMVGLGGRLLPEDVQESGGGLESLYEEVLSLLLLDSDGGGSVVGVVGGSSGSQGLYFCTLSRMASIGHT